MKFAPSKIQSPLSRDVVLQRKFVHPVEPVHDMVSTIADNKKAGTYV